MSKSTVERIETLSEDYWQRILKHEPTWATALGHRQYDAILPDKSPEESKRYCADMADILAECEKLDANGIPHGARVTLEILKGSLKVEILAQDHPDHRWAVNPLFGTHVWLSELSARQPTDSETGIQNLLARYGRIPALLEQECQNLQEGIDNGQTAFTAAVERVVNQLDRLLAVDAAESSYMPPALRQGELNAEKLALKKRLATAIETGVYPALKRYQRFLKDQYLPKARTTPGLSSMPGGSDYYAYCIKVYTGVDRSPQVVHDTGLAELKAIHREMSEIGQKYANTSNVAEIQAHFKAQAAYQAQSKAEILSYNQKMVQKAWDALPDYFERFPKENCEVCMIEAYREADSPSGYYDRAPEDGSRPARYYVNTHEPENRPLYNMEALAYHEAVPGHHLQVGLAQELETLPNFRRHLGDTAYIEGWALYSERLSDEMGLYSNDASRFGMLTFQAWRAARLVIDTGLHAMNWTRAQSIQFLIDHTGLSETEATIEVDRYISMPGQALAYMLGRIEIDALRKKAEERLGEDFDIRAFHSQILNNGAVPLHTLRRLIDQWLDESLVK